jgi:predicted short-subunit dehydrogenase-like oxidoreductase (DUF2520 family)
MKIAVVGAGRAGTALAVHWRKAGHEIVAVSGRNKTAARAATYLPDVPFMPNPAEAAKAAEVVVVGVPDDAIVAVCESLATAGAVGAGQSVMHLSGASGLDMLASARAAGAHTMSFHPLQTFPTVEAAIDRLPGSAVAITTEDGDEDTALIGERLAADAGARAFRLDDNVKSLYHAAAVFASNYLVAVTAEAEELFKAAGLPEPNELFMPLVRASLDNVASLGPEAALTGPAARGDAGTVARNLEALAANSPQAIPSYVALARVALDLAEHSGRLAPEERAKVEEVLARWK